ncbi:hypothetical protein DRQ50_01975 [bacterium]|nr:MAG: hypothetical protein DRQ50_01975 [bacterium]
MSTRHFRRAVLTACGLLILALPAAADYEQTFTFDGNELEVADMIGAVAVTRASGNQFTVKVTVRGDDATDEILGFKVKEGSEAYLAVIFPTDEHDDYVYPALGRGSKTRINFNHGHGETSWLKQVFSGGGTIEVRGTGGGLEVWADLEIGVPEGGSLKMLLGVGEISATDVDGDLNLDTHSGRVTADSIKGSLLVDTGSGAVEVTDITGPVNVDTGSGSVKVRGVKGDKVLVDTGSGSVKVTDVTCRELHVDTGSGGVKARGVKADKAKIDTGSGSVVLELAEMGSGRFIIDTGSGSIELALPDDASARIEADTGSGSVRNKIEDADVRRQERDELLMTVGDGEARVTLDAGSGSITIRRL